MSESLIHAGDIRQFPAWAQYMERIGWEVHLLDGAYLYGKRLPGGIRLFKLERPRLSDWNGLKEILDREKALYIHIEPHNAYYASEELKRIGFHRSGMCVSHQATIRIDIALSLSKIRHLYSDNTSRLLKKTHDMRIETVSLTSKNLHEVFGRFYQLARRLADDKRFYLPKYAEYAKKAEAFAGSSLVLFAYGRGKDPIATLWCAFHAGVGVYVQTGMTPQGYEHAANYRLVDAAIETLKTEKKCRVFDFESIFDVRYPSQHRDWSGYTEFKRKFGGEVIYYPSPYERWKWPW
jgi:hypothetical protein